MECRSLRIVAAMLVALASRAPAQPFAYFTQPTSTVNVVDVATNRVVTSIDVGGGPAAAAVAPFGDRAFVANTGPSGTPAPYLTFIDTTRQAFAARMDLPTCPAHMALSSDASLLYVVGSPCTLPVVETDLVVVDTRTRQVIAPVTRLASVGARAIAVDEPHGRVYIADGVSGSLAVLDMRTHGALATIPVGGTPASLALDSPDNRLYVADAASGKVSVIDTATSAILATFPTAASPSAIAVHPSGSPILVVASGDGKVQAFDGETHQLLREAPLPGVQGIGLTPDGQWAYVTRPSLGLATLLRTKDFANFGDVAMGGVPRGEGEFIGGSPPPRTAGPLTGLWWNPAESGWGVHLTQRGGTLFAAWFTYDRAGSPKWYTASSCTLRDPLPCPTCVANAVCTGKLYETNGGGFFNVPFDPSAVHVHPSGTLLIRFHDLDDASMTYILGDRGIPVVEEIERQRFRDGAASGPVDYTDLWSDPAQPGWGLGVVQQADVMFLTWFAYEDRGTPTWLVAPDCAVKVDRRGCTGTLYRTSGPPGPVAAPVFDATQVRSGAVGQVDLVFTDADHGVIQYTVDGRRGSKSVQRQAF